MKKLLLVPFTLLMGMAGALAQPDQLFKDLTPGTTHSNPERYFNAGNTMYFVAIVGPSRVHQVWKTDGNPANTVMLKDSLIITNIGGVLNFIGEINGNVIFTKEVNGSTTSSSKTELWKTDGTPAGTVVYDTLTHQSGSGGGGAMRNFTVVGDKIFFSMGESNGRELWVTDGTAAGTMEVINLAPGTISGIQAPGVVDMPMVAYNGKVYFRGSIQPGNTELFSSDGTAAGTTLVHEVNPNTTMSGGSDPENLIVYNNELYFFADDGSSNSSNGLWKTDGTNTVKVFQNALTNGAPTLFNSALYFINGIDLWKTNGTAGGTVMVNDSAATSVLGANNDYLFTEYAKYKPVYPYYDYFYWRTDNAGNNTQVSYDVAKSSSFNVIDNKMYTSRADSGSFTVFGLWESDGTAAGTQKILTYGPGIHIFKDTIYFAHYDAATGAGTELWILAPGSSVTIEEKASTEAGITVYPNPSTGAIRMQTGSAENMAVKVYDLFGKEVYSNTALSNGERIDLGHLSAGAYVLRVESGNSISTGRLIIQK